MGQCIMASGSYFYPRSPRGERHGCRRIDPRELDHFYPRSPRGERPAPRGRGGQCEPISIHAPREGSDAGLQQPRRQARPISIHAPREGSDCAIMSPFQLIHYFYPRSPRGERPSMVSSSMPISFYFYPRSPRGERRHPGGLRPGGRAISIHAPREGSDQGVHDFFCRARQISIHAPREGSDFLPARTPIRLVIFLSTLPARGATTIFFSAKTYVLFLSTLPARGATVSPIY